MLLEQFTPLREDFRFHPWELFSDYWLVVITVFSVMFWALWPTNTHILSPFCRIDAESVLSHCSETLGWVLGHCHSSEVLSVGLGNSSIPLASQQVTCICYQMNGDFLRHLWQPKGQEAAGYIGPPSEKLPPATSCHIWVPSHKPLRLKCWDLGNREWAISLNLPPNPDDLITKRYLAVDLGDNQSFPLNAPRG